MSVNPIPLKSFLDNKKTDYRLHIKNGKLHYHKIGRLSRFAAKLGFGNAAMSNVSSFIRKNYDTCFVGEKKFEDYEQINAFFIRYNQNRSVKWKKAKEIKLKNSEKTAYVKNLFERIKILLIKIKENNQYNISDLELITQTLNANSKSVVLTPNENEQLFNELLQLKNEVRSTLLPLKANKTYKGKETVQSGNLSLIDQNILKLSLKTIQKCILTQYFRDRLKNDRAELSLIQNAFQSNKYGLDETIFLDNQLSHWGKKLDQGKPIAIPKWYHCTKGSDTMDTILKTDILYMHQKAFGGAFVSTHPEFGGTYGRYCIALSNEIETTGTYDPTTKAIINPVFTCKDDVNKVRFSDAIKPPSIMYSKHPRIWAGFQKGKSTLNAGVGTQGIPLQKIDRIKNGTLEYYKDTSVSFIYSRYDDISSIGLRNRVQVLTASQGDALVNLIKLSYPLTLPVSWKSLLT